MRPGSRPGKILLLPGIRIRNSVISCADGHDCGLARTDIMRLI
jgi:hypothetical protein